MTQQVSALLDTSCVCQGYLVFHFPLYFMMEEILQSLQHPGAVKTDTMATYLEERVGNFSKEPVGNGERAAWSGFTHCSQQSLELGMDSSIFFTLQT